MSILLQEIPHVNSDVKNSDVKNDFKNEPYYETSREIGKVIREFGYTRNGIEHLAECIGRHGAVVLAGIIVGIKE